MLTWSCGMGQLRWCPAGGGSVRERVCVWPAAGEGGSHPGQAAPAPLLLEPGARLSYGVHAAVRATTGLSTVIPLDPSQDLISEETGCERGREWWLECTTV